MKKKKLLTIGLTATLLFSNQLPTMQALAVANEEATEQVEKTDGEVEKDTKLPVVDETPEPETPKEPEVPTTPEVPETPEAPTEVPETPEIEVPETPAAPEVTEPSEPEVPETPAAPEVPEPTTEDSEVQVETVNPESEETKKAAKKPTKQVEKADKEEKEDKANNKAEGENVIVDDNLRKAILRELNEYDDPQKPVTKEMLEGLTSLSANGYRIEGLTGLEHAENLTSLSLISSQLTDITVLSGLTNLETLYLRSNQLTDITVLSGLTNLETLHLNNNQLTDIAPLSGLTNLKALELQGNQLTDIAPLSGLTNLEALELQSNQLTDITSLSSLNKITSLSLQDNRITDITPLASLVNLDYLHLYGNKIQSVSGLAGLTNLDFLSVNSNYIKDLSPLKIIKDNATSFYCSGQSINIDITDKKEYFVSPLVDIDGNSVWFTNDDPIPGLVKDGESKILIDRNMLLPKVSKTIDNWNVSIVDHAERTNFDGIEDPALLEIIEIKLGRKVTSADDLKTLKELDIYNGANSVKSLKGLEYATNLKSIGFYGINMALKNISSLNNIGIEELAIWGSNLDLFNELDVSNVNDLSVFNTEIKDWDKFLGKFSNLESLVVADTNLSDIRIIPTIVNNTADLFLGYNQIRDLSPLSSHKGTISAYDQRIFITTEQSPLKNPIIGLDSNPVEVTRQDGETFTDELIWETEEANFSFSEGSFSGNVSVIDGESMLLSEDKLEGEVIEDPTLRILARFAIKEMKENQRVTVGDWRTTEENLKVIESLEIWDIYDLGLDFAPIQTLEGLQIAESLRYLDVDSQEISSIKPIKGLNLDYLDVSSNQISDFSGVKAKNILAYDQKLSYTATKKDGKVRFHKNDLLIGKHGKERFWIGDQELEVVDNMIEQAVEEGQTELLINVSERHGSYEGVEEPEDNTVWTDVEGYSLDTRLPAPPPPPGESEYEESTGIQATVLVSLVDAEPETDPSDEDPDNSDDTTDPTDDSNGDGGTDDTSDNTNPSDSSDTDSSDSGTNDTSDSSNAGKGGSQNGGSNSGTKGKDLPKTGETVQWGASLLGFGLIGAVVAMWKKRRKS